jgi:hypothetical protein
MNHKRKVFPYRLFLTPPFVVALPVIIYLSMNLPKKRAVLAIYLALVFAFWAFVTVRSGMVASQRGRDFSREDRPASFWLTVATMCGASLFLVYKAATLF